MVFYPDATLAGDDTNWWGPNAACVAAMLDELGFPRVEQSVNPAHPERGIFHGFRP
jgi:tRNA (mo5U34)-methyltransferase